MSINDSNNKTRKHKKCHFNGGNKKTVLDFQGRFFKDIFI